MLAFCLIHNEICSIQEKPKTLMAYTRQSTILSNRNHPNLIPIKMAFRWEFTKLVYYFLDCIKCIFSTFLVKVEMFLHKRHFHCFSINIIVELLSRRSVVSNSIFFPSKNVLHWIQRQLNWNSIDLIKIDIARLFGHINLLQPHYFGRSFSIWNIYDKFWKYIR